VTRSRPEQELSISDPAPPRPDGRGNLRYPAPEPPRPVLPRPAPKIEDLLLLAWWLHARSRIAGGLRRRDTVQMQQCGLHEKMDLQQTLDDATL
jgi:hypothetical protein